MKIKLNYVIVLIILEGKNVCVYIMVSPSGVRQAVKTRRLSMNWRNKKSRPSGDSRPNDIFVQTFSFVFGGAFNIALMLLTVYFIYRFTLSAFAFGKEFGQEMNSEKPSKEIEVSIKDGATVSEVAAILEDKGVISSALMFQLESLLKKNSESFSGGTFMLNTNMNASEINWTLRNVVVYGTDVSVTIPEGYTLKEIALLLESKELVDAEDFITVCNTESFDYDFLMDLPERENRLEGYLFPDTYLFAEQSSPEQIINKMLLRFGEIYTLEYQLQAEAMGLTTDELVTIASIIEKEIRVGPERSKASEVIYNRLNKGMYLQMCSTVLYALDKRKDRLLLTDLEVKSPYNTYLNSGLPIGPISNPGQACIQAALNPGTGNLLYFVVKDEETGEHVFTDNENDFYKAKADYNQQF